MNLSKTIIQAKARNKQAEKALFLQFAPLVLTLCRRYANQNVEAQDYLQECFILVFNKITQYDSTKGDFEGWLYRVCTNRILELMRKAKKSLPLTYPDILPDQLLTKTELATIPHEEVLKAIQQLPHGYREVFNLYVFEEWTHRQISEALGIAESSSRSQLTRAKKMLKFALQKHRNNPKYERQLA